MFNDQNLRENLIELLHGGSAHVSFEKALADINSELRNFRPEPNIHSIYEELEHMRIAQEDIIRYTIEEGWESPAWPDQYWPDNNDHMTSEIWESTHKRFFKDLDRVVDLVHNKSIELTSEIPHGEGRTYLREILLIADHNAYHIGKIIDIRKMLGDW
jgi:hypothetical protein